MSEQEKMRELIFEWNQQHELFSFKNPRPKRAKILDETWRDGLQSTTVNDPPIEKKLALLRLMCKLKIDAVNIGYPAAAPGIYQDAMRMAQSIRREEMPIIPYCLGRTVISDIEPMVEIKKKTGAAINAFLFVGASPIRHFVEHWEMGTVLKRIHESVGYAVTHGMPTMFFTEDTTRSNPGALRQMWETAIAAGATRIGIADTVGYVNPNGISQIVQYCRSIIETTGKDIAIDFHGHNDRGMAVANSLSAIMAGADRVHGCALGIGERVGNTNMEQLLVNLKIDGYPGYADRDLQAVRDYVMLVSEACHVPIPADYPIVGQNAFRTSTGIHAAAVIKAQAMGGSWLANRVYSSVPAEEVGLKQIIEVGPQSGKSNVQHWMAKHGYNRETENEAIINRILTLVKEKDRVLTQEEMRNMVESIAEKQAATA